MRRKQLPPRRVVIPGRIGSCAWCGVYGPVVSDLDDEHEVLACHACTHEAVKVDGLKGDR